MMNSGRSGEYQRTGGAAESKVTHFIPAKSGKTSLGPRSKQSLRSMLMPTLGRYHQA
jgi:hypothetical protein